VPVIRSIRHRGLRRLYESGDESKLKQDQLPRIRRILAVLDASTKPADMDLPGWRLHRLRGDLRGYYSVSVSGNWRLIFKFDREPHDVDLVDYH
jgi:proteic killer suppression protein